MAGAVTTGGAWPCGEGTAQIGSVVFLCAEDGAADTIVPRLMATGADRSKVSIVTAVRTGDGGGRRAFDLQRDLQGLERLIAEIGDVRLVVIDPISSYLGTKVDSHVNAAVRGVLEPVGEMAARLRVAILSVTHPPKGTGTTAINRFIGSIAFVAAARAAFMVTGDPDDTGRRLLLGVKSNLAPLAKGCAFRLEQCLVGEPGKGIVASRVAWELTPVEITADAALQAADARGQADAPARAEAEEFLRGLLADGPVPAKQVKVDAKEAGLSWVTVRRAKVRLGVKPQKQGMDGGWSWSLPGGRRCSAIAEDPHHARLSTFAADDHLRATSSNSARDDDAWGIPGFLLRRAQ